MLRITLLIFLIERTLASELSGLFTHNDGLKYIKVKRHKFVTVKQVSHNSS
jgi:hypothetical protein